MSDEQPPIPPEILVAGRKLFTTDEAMRAWLDRPALWANGETPNRLIAAGASDAVVGALRGLAHGTVL